MGAMHVLLAQAPFADTFGYSMPPPGLLRLGGWLRERGVEVRLEDLAWRLAAGYLPGDDGLDTAAARLLRTHLTEHGPWLVGLSTMGATLPIALCIARELRRLEPDVAIVLGGPGVSGVDEELLERFDFVDGVLRGEGELPLAELLAPERRQGARPDFRGVAGWTWREADGATASIVREPDAMPLDDLDRVASPAWDLLPPLTDYKALTGSADGLVPVDSGRGCSFDCSFCSIPRFWDRRSRCLSPERLCDELDALRHLDGAGQAYLCHDLFGANRANAWDLCDELLARAERSGRPPMPWEVRARIDHLDAELIERMGRAGCYRVLLGVESAAESVRREAGKRLVGTEQHDELLARLTHLGEAGITPILSLILGLPGEGDDELRATLDLCLDAALVAPTQLSLHLPNPQPGCRLGDEHASSSRPLEGIPPDMALGSGLTGPERELIAETPTLFSSWSLLTEVTGEERLRELADLAATLPELLMRLPRTVALYCRITDCDVLDLARRLTAESTSFEGLARREHHDLLDDALAWEQARLRCVARGAGPVHRGEDHELLVELLATGHDLGELDETLIEGGPLPAPNPGVFAVGHAAASERPDAGSASISTRRLSPDLARLLVALRDETSADGVLADLGPGDEGRTALIEHLASLDDGSLLRALPSPAPTET